MEQIELNGYDLSRSWFNFCFENPEDVKPIHTAIYFFSIEHCNRMGWKEKFGLPTTMVMECIGVKSYNTYIEALRELVSWGFIKMIETSKNQYSSNIVALSKFDKALYKALDKATSKHSTKQRLKQSESTIQSIDSIDKPITNKPITIKQEETVYKKFAHLSLSDADFLKLCDAGYSVEQIDNILEEIENYKLNKKYTSLYLTAKKWLEKEKSSGQKESNRGASAVVEAFSQIQMRS